MIRVAIAGGAGYTAGELVRLLVNHPAVELKYIQSGSHDGEPISSVHSDLIYSDLKFSNIDFEDIDVLFICMGHGNSAKFLAENPVPTTVKIIDLSNDFRLKADAGEFVYGAPELNREQIKACRCVANPGCFATSINLALMPLAAAGILPEEVTVTGITGSTGAGQKPTQDTHFSNRNSNLSNYKVFTHQHLGEIGEMVVAAGGSEATDIAFVPVRGCHTRGIMSDVVVRLDEDLDTITKIFKDFYAAHPFVCVSDKPVYMKQVVNTNYCFLSLQKEGRKLLITSVVDNLLKGASGQAVQNMNLMFGLDEMAGLRLKANYF
ncbi:MAG: N-acetyl-gamma-glutamyl-phosphate reductase [Alistipes sp.]|nr:N-acetyl-gamma-glutamyl-phosphate reductase [Alistipes sp.]